MPNLEARPKKDDALWRIFISIEDIHSMTWIARRGFVLVILGLCAVGLGWGASRMRSTKLQRAPQTPRLERAQVRLISHTAREIVIEFESPPYEALKNPETGEVVRFSVRGAQPTSRTGFPVVPSLVQPVDCPPGEIRLQILETDEETHPLPSYSAVQEDQPIDPPEQGLKEVGPQSPIQGRRLEGSTPEPSAEVWPLRAVELHEGGFFRGHRLMAVRYYPLRIDSRRRVMKWVPRIRVRLILPDWEGSPDYANRRYDAPNERALLENIVGPLAPAVLPRHQIEERERPALGIQTEFSPRFKIIVDEEGIYHISQEMLASAGVPVEQIDPRTIKVKVRGREIPIFVQGEADGVFDPYDYIEFYGIENRETWTSLVETLYKDPWSDENVYWFSWAGPYGLRLGEQNAEWMPNTGSPASHLRTTVHFEEDNYYSPLSYGATREPYVSRLHEMGPYGVVMDHWFYSTGVRSFETRDYPISVAHPDTAGAPGLQQVIVRAALQGISYGHHRAILYLNGHTDKGLSIGRISWGDDRKDWSSHTAAILETVPDPLNAGIVSRDLRHGENTVSLSVTGDGLSGATDQVTLNWIEISYERMMKASDGYMRFDFDVTSGETFKFDIRGFASPNIQVWKLGMARLTNTDVRYLTPVDEDPSWAVRFLLTPTQAYRLIAFDDTYIKTPVAILPEQSARDLRDLPGAEYILLVHDSFLEEPAIEALRQRREGTFPGGVEVVTPTEVYEQFNAGIVNPEAIRNFLIYAYDHWTVRPTHLCIVGDGNYDVKDYRHYGGNLIPSFYPSVSQYGPVSADGLFGFVSGPPWDLLPDIAVGRISCRTAEELETYVEKIAVYEDDPDYASPWHSNYIFMSDKTGGGTSFIQYSEGSISMMPDYVNITRVYSDSLPSGSERETAVREAFRKGGIIVNYNGHGGGGQWAAEDLLRVESEQFLLNRRRYPFITSFTCYTNAYDAGRQGEVLGEAFLFQRNITGELIGGIGVYASCGTGFAAAGRDQQAHLFNFVADPPGQTLGEIVQANKTRYWLAYGADPPNVNAPYSQQMQMSLLGDPGVKLAVPQNVFEPEIDKTFVIAPMDSIVLDTVVVNPDSIRIDTVEIITIPGDTVLISGTLPFDIGDGHVVQAWYDLYEEHGVRLVEESLFPEIITTQDFESPPLVVPRSFTTTEARYVVYVSNPATQEDGIGYVSVYAEDLGDSTLFLDPGSWPESVVREGVPFYVQVRILHRIGIDRVRMRGVFSPPSGPVVLDTLAMEEVTQYLWRTPVSLGPYEVADATYNVSFTLYDDSGSAISSPTYGLDLSTKPDILFSSVHPGYPVIMGDTYPYARVMLQKTVPEHSTVPDTLTMFIFAYRPVTETLPADTFESYATIADIAHLGRTFLVDIPVHFRPGRWFLRTYIDPFDEIAESNEDNNLRTPYLVADHFPVSRAEGIYYEDPHEPNVSSEYWRQGTLDTMVLRIPPGALLQDSSVVCYEYPRKFTAAESLFFARVLGPNAGLRQLPASQRPDIFTVTLSDSTDRLAPGSAADLSLIRKVSVGTIEFADTVGSLWPPWSPSDTSDRDIFQRRLGTDYWTKMDASLQATRDSTLVDIDTVGVGQESYVVYTWDRSYRLRYSTRTNYLGSFTIFTLDRDSMDTWPPQVDLAVSGERYVPGAYVPTNPQMFFYLSDPSGIDRRPGHFRIVLDGDTIPYSEIAWTDSVETSGDQVALIRPHLSLGDHTVEVYARDNLGNDTTCVTAFQVEGTFGIDFALNYPNPFNAQTKIVYVLTGQTDEYVKVKIYTVSGRLIRTLRESERAVINYRTLVWDGRDEAGEAVANGVYFGRIVASQGGKQVEKVIKMARVR